MDPIKILVGCQSGGPKRADELPDNPPRLRSSAFLYFMPHYLTRFMSKANITASINPLQSPPNRARNLNTVVHLGWSYRFFDAESPSYRLT